MSDFVYLCPDCGLGFSSQVDLQIHCNADHSPKNFVCNQCNKNFPNLSAQECHVEAHMKKCHCCIICGALCKDKLDMYIHVIVSHKHQDMVCDSCLEMFEDKSSLKSHTLDMHAEEIPSIVNKWEIFCNIHSSQNVSEDELYDLLRPCDSFCPDSKREDQLGKSEILSSQKLFTDMLSDLLTPFISSSPDSKLEEDQLGEKENSHSLQNLSSDDDTLNDLMSPSDSFYSDSKQEEDKLSEKENLNHDKLCEKDINGHNYDDMELFKIVGTSSLKEKCTSISTPKDNVVKSVGELFNAEGDFYIGKEFDRITKDISVNPDDIYEHVENLINNSKHFSPKHKDSFTCGACGLVFNDSEDYIMQHICEVPSNIYHLPVCEKKVDPEIIEKFSKWKKQAFSYKYQESSKVKDGETKKQKHPKENSSTKDQERILSESDISLLTLISSLSPSVSEKEKEKVSSVTKDMRKKAESKNDEAAEKSHVKGDEPVVKARCEGDEPVVKARCEGDKPEETSGSEL